MSTPTDDSRVNDDDAADRTGLNIKLAIVWLVSMAIFVGIVAGIVWLVQHDLGVALAVVFVGALALAGVRGNER